MPPAAEGGRRPGAVKRLKAAPYRRDVEADFAADRVWGWGVGGGGGSITVQREANNDSQRRFVFHTAGQCISQSLVCNGDQDCEEDGLDEQCPPFKHIVCNKWIVPPNIELLGLG